MEAEINELVPDAVETTNRDGDPVVMVCGVELYPHQFHGLYTVVEPPQETQDEATE